MNVRHIAVKTITENLLMINLTMVFSIYGLACRFLYGYVCLYADGERGPADIIRYFTVFLVGSFLWAISTDA